MQQLLSWSSYTSFKQSASFEVSSSCNVYYRVSEDWTLPNRIEASHSHVQSQDQPANSKLHIFLLLFISACQCLFLNDIYYTFHHHQYFLFWFYFLSFHSCRIHSFSFFISPSPLDASPTPTICTHALVDLLLNHLLHFYVDLKLEFSLAEETKTCKYYV